MAPKPPTETDPTPVPPRAGWDECFAAAAAAEDDAPLLPDWLAAESDVDWTW